ncbi:ISLre2 family transposase [Enterococcus faecium]|uniref:ISLre2 family transposase n=1 Tax=Enterococcus faecium TaxID=1352 RepID=UPI003F8B1E37
MFNELDFEREYQEKAMERFLEKLHAIERKVGMEVQAQGWKYVKTAQRTVIFTFGEITFSRKCYRRNHEYRYPVDEVLGLPKYTRFSMELLLQVAELATKMPYREVVRTFHLLKGIYITKDTVSKAVQLAGQYYQEREVYRYYEENQMNQRQKVPVLYIEGDGIRIKTNRQGEQTAELAHFVIHRGCEEEYRNRKQLIDKHEIVSMSNKKAREEVVDYIYNHYELGEETVVITNSDMGKGYTPYVFKELVAGFSGKHLHFWDRYHLNERIKDFFKGYPPTLQERFFQAIATHNKQEARLVLETIESIVETEEEMVRFEQFSKKFLRDFVYTQSPKTYGFSSDGIGIMESQQSKIANRMKKKGMYWSALGGETMGRMIVDVKEDQLRELFFGKWREEYAQFELLDRPRVQLKKGREEKDLTHIRVDQIRKIMK